jgi:hypothetical protein
MIKEFNRKVIETLHKSVYEIQLDVALAYFCNQPGFVSTHGERAREAWLASADFMKEMEKAYEDIKVDQ